MCSWVHLGGNPILYSPSPRGECENCCEIREAKDIKFFLYTRKNRQNAKQLFLTDERRLRHINKTSNVVIYLHGFSESAPGVPGASSYEIREGAYLNFLLMGIISLLSKLSAAFLDIGDYSVILVDWSPITALPWSDGKLIKTNQRNRFNIFL